jgi:heme oxygenase
MLPATAGAGAPSGRSGAADASQVEAERPLSLRLRAETAEAHRAVAPSLGLPDTIRTRDEYVACLTRFLQLYRPLEARIRAIAGPLDFGLDLPRRTHTPRLAADLSSLLARPPEVEDAAADALPDLPSFAHALGALYVLEGATLGGQIIVRHLRAAGLDGIETTGAFFGGRGPETGAMWRAFRDILDRYGADCPFEVPAVIAGAEGTFLAVGRWMHASRWSRA